MNNRGTILLLLAGLISLAAYPAQAATSTDDGAGSFRLSSSTYTVGEADGTATIRIERVNGSTGEVTVGYSTRQLDQSLESSAHDVDFGVGDDYDGTYGQLTFPDGVTEREFTVSITDDGEENQDLQFGVYLYDASTALADPNEGTVTIVDDDAVADDRPGEFRLSSSTHTVGEGDGTATIRVERVNGSTGEATVGYSTRQLDQSLESSAHDADFGAGDDYDGTYGTLTFPDGVTEREFTVSITDDGEDNPDLRFGIFLYEPSTVLSDPNEGTVTIVDDDDAVVDDRPGEFRLSSNTHTVGEGDGTATIRVERVNGSTGEATVGYSTRQLDQSLESSAHDADFGAGDDYDGTYGQLTFPDGVTERAFTVSITDDGEDNPDLRFGVYLYESSTALSDPNEGTVTIIDDDEALTAGSATIHWTAPTTRTDGSALSLSQLAGFAVYVGTTAGDLSKVTTVNDGSAIEHTLSDLPSGEYYFAVAAIDVDGLEGPLSEVIAFTVR